jgi:murein DD-endopeptidase MepM/ murein hydrolase activator NlpD
MHQWTRPLRPVIFALALMAANAAAAASLCGDMMMPPAALKTVGRGFSAWHSGVDLLAPPGSPVRAAADGTVIFAGRYFGYGNMVDLRHADGLVTRYGHLSAFAPGLHPGTVLKMGALLGRIGATGHATTPHVHFEVRVNGHAIDPRPAIGLAACPSAPTPREPLEEARAPETHPGGSAR